MKLTMSIEEYNAYIKEYGPNWDLEAVAQKAWDILPIDIKDFIWDVFTECVEEEREARDRR